MNDATKKIACQDGADFYKADLMDGEGPIDEDCHIVSYPGMVKHDYDMEGANKARERFLSEHPEYVMEGDE